MAEDEPGFDGTQTYRRHREVRTEVVDESLFVIDRDREAIHMLTPLARAIWDVLAHPVRAAEIAEVLAEAYPAVPAQLLEADVLAIFEELWDHDLIEAENAAGSGHG